MNYFHYDSVVNVGASSELITKHSALVAELSGCNVLASTFNHRYLNLQEKNQIKNFVDLGNFDHLMMTIRPSAKKLIDANRDINEQYFRHCTEVLFLVNSMARYDIPVGIVDQSILETVANGTSDLSAVVEGLEKFVREISDLFPSGNDFGKTFPYISHFHKIKPKLAHKRIRSLSEIACSNAIVDPMLYAQQISEQENHIFWLGFDPKFKAVPHEKAYSVGYFEEELKHAKQGEGLFEQQLRYCSRCCLPETMEGMSFDELGMCVPCRSSEDKMHIDWEEKRKEFERIMAGNKQSDYYDCLLPMSGGKDSTYQAYLLKFVVDAMPLAVTHGHGWHTHEGRYNLENCLQQFDLDHIFFCVARTKINKAAKKSLMNIGDACWHCHIGAGSFPLVSALAWDVKLMCYGESAAEKGGRSRYATNTEAPLLYHVEISAKVRAEDYADDQITTRELSCWYYPNAEELKNSELRYIHIGNYFFWDEARQVEFIKRNFNWLDSKVENTYKGFKSVECVMAGVHDYANFIKRGIGRATIHVSDDVRRGLMTREEGFEIAKAYDTQRPHALDFYLGITGITEDEFNKTLIEARSKSKYASRLKR